ncbi:MAG: NADH:ubiquinone reductase (Na(+)-transporting) subunit B [Deltaproteobacteria bacterium]|nr:MAG: NADH:ubiquinone reductase (Na(+)-transporting) subunit B [Deltaproteobacteria bacterium]
MKAFLVNFFDGLRPNFEKGGKYEKFWWALEGVETVALTPGERTHKGAHIRDHMDMKRLMIFVLFALTPAILTGMWNIGFQAYTAENLTASGLDCFLRGAYHMLPIIIMSYTAGGLAELVFCHVRGHEVNEGFLVTAMLFPLTLPPTIPLWMVAVGVIFGVVIGKEVFGGVGMNILNPALTARAFLFFTYPGAMSGAKVWDVAGSANLLTHSGTPIDSYTGATALNVASGTPGAASAVSALTEAGFTLEKMALGAIPGSMGETSVVAIAAGALFLIATGIASWRTMVGCVLGLVGVTSLFAYGVWEPGANTMLSLPPAYHLVMGGFAFGTVFMATDPVSSCTTETGRFIYGVLIGVLCGLVRVVNPAYPEGMMLAILFMNVFAPLIDYYIVKGTTRRRVARLAAA